jgi:2-polyprenyl-6-methoxyphenol hydroxylase-like FAD-dependent oxidoreductase
METQGMNTSIQDSFNLGWKLALIVKKLAAHSSLLDTDMEERQPVVTEMLKQTTKILIATCQLPLEFSHRRSTSTNRSTERSRRR